jgi:uncharacterized protein (DUF433 family)
VVIDPDICHGKPTFVGTRIMVWQVLDRVAKGKPFAEIVEDWPDSFPPEAITEAVLLAKRAFLDHARDYGEESQSA